MVPFEDPIVIWEIEIGTILVEEHEVQAGVPDDNEIAAKHLADLVLSLVEELWPSLERDQLVVGRQNSVFGLFRFFDDLPFLSNLAIDRVEVRLFPHMSLQGLVEKFAHEDNLVRVVSCCLTVLILCS